MSKIDAVLLQIESAKRQLKAKQNGMPRRLLVAGIINAHTTSEEDRRAIAVEQALRPYGLKTEAEAKEAGCQIEYHPMSWLKVRRIDKMDPRDHDVVTNAGKGVYGFDPFDGCIDNDPLLNTPLGTEDTCPHP